MSGSGLTAGSGLTTGSAMLRVVYDLAFACDWINNPETELVVRDGEMSLGCQDKAHDERGAGAAPRQAGLHKNRPEAVSFRFQVGILLPNPSSRVLSASHWL